MSIYFAILFTVECLFLFKYQDFYCFRTQLIEGDLTPSQEKEQLIEVSSAFKKYSTIELITCYSAIAFVLIEFFVIQKNRKLQKWHKWLQ